MMNAIPTIQVPSIKDYTIEEHDEALVALSKQRFRVQSQYYKQGIAGSYKDCYAREQVALALQSARSYLPAGIDFVILDGYRPICIQQRLWNYYHQKMKNENPNMEKEELEFKTSFFVSKPSYDINKPSLHNTGGAIDLTLCDKSGKWLNMGTDFDDFSDRAWSNHFEVYEVNEEVRNNRRILYNAMIKAGFTNLPSEWWHYDYGDKFWSYFKNRPALYKGILDIDFPDRFPLM